MCQVTPDGTTTCALPRLGRPRMAACLALTPSATRRTPQPAPGTGASKVPRNIPLVAIVSVRALIGRNRFGSAAKCGSSPQGEQVEGAFTALGVAADHGRP